MAKSIWCRLGLHTWQKGLTVPRGIVNLILFEPAFNLLIRIPPETESKNQYSTRSLTTKSDKMCQKCGKSKLTATIWLIKKATKLAILTEESHLAKKNLKILSQICTTMAQKNKNETER